jgi:trigger factor
MKTEIKKLEKSQIEVNFELDEKEFQGYLEKALLHLKEHVKVDGFRKGQVPLKIVEEKVGQENVLMEAGDLAVKKSYSQFVKENDIEPIGDPDVQITKIAKGNPFLFKVTVSVLPEITLPDYKKIAGTVKAQEISVDEKEIQDTIDYLQKSRAKFSQKDAPAQDKDFVEIEYSTPELNGGKAIKDRFILGEGGFMKDFESNVIGMGAGEEKEFVAKFPDTTVRKDLAGKDATFKVKMLSVQNMEVAEINDDFAKSLGAFDTLVALKENLKEGITLEKQETEKQRTRGEILEKISAQITFDIPEKMVSYEEQRLLEDLKTQVAGQFKIPFEQYLASIKKTEQEMKDTYKLEAEKRIKNFLVLREIGKQENIEVTDEELAEDFVKLTKNYTKEQLEKIDIEQLKEYSKGAIFNEKVFLKLETFSK